MRSFQSFIETIEKLIEELPPVEESVQVRSAAQLLADAARNLREAPTDFAFAMKALEGAYNERQLKTYKIREGLEVSFRERTATTLKMLYEMTTQFGTGGNMETVWIDDGDQAKQLTIAELVEHGPLYARQFAMNLFWVSSKRSEIAASEDPLSVSLE